MAERVRRAAGTRTFGDLVTHPWQLWEQLSGSVPERVAADVEVLEAGEGRAVAAFARAGDRFRRGLLILRIGADASATWEPSDGPAGSRRAVTLTPPFDIEGAGPVTGPGSRAIKRDMFRLLALNADGQRWELAVPAMDIPLIRTAPTRIARSSPVGDDTSSGDGAI